MALLQTTQQTTKSREQVLADAIAAKTAQMQKGFDRLQELFQSQLEFVWNNPTFTPEEVVAGYGTNAAELFRVGYEYQVFANKLAGNPVVSPVPSNYSYVINENGTVTLTKIEEEDTQTGE